MSLKRNASGCYDSTAFEAIMKLEGGFRMDVVRGDIFFIKKSNSKTGSEFDGGRPAVVVSNDVGNEHSSVVEVVYLTTNNNKKGMPTHVDVIGKVQSTALCEQIYTVSKERLGQYMKSCTTKEMKAIDDALKISLGLENDNSNLDVKDSEVEKLKNQLKEAGAKIKELKQSKVTLENDKEKIVESLIETSKEKSQYEFEFKCAKDELEKAELNKTELNVYTIQLETERDLYKEQYEALLERLINQ